MDVKRRFPPLPVPLSVQLTLDAQVPGLPPNFKSLHFPANRSLPPHEGRPRQKARARERIAIALSACAEPCPIRALLPPGGTQSWVIRTLYCTMEVSPAAVMSSAKIACSDVVIVAEV
jgi:hypothetical protein